MSAVKKAVSGATGFLVGGKSTPGYQKSDAASADELARIKGIEGDLSNLYADQSSNAQGNADELTQLFKNQLVQFLNADHGPNATPEQIAASQHFVDQTFYKPAQNALQSYEEEFGASQAAKTAALGRNPNLDLASQQAIFREGMKNRSAMELERGSRVAQDARGQNEASYNRQLGSLNVGMTGSNFLNSLAQQAFTNRLGLLNGKSQLADYFQRDRLGNKEYQGPGTSSGVLTNITALGKGFSDVAGLDGGAKQNALMQYMGGGGSLGNSGQGKPAAASLGKYIGGGIG